MIHWWMGYMVLAGVPVAVATELVAHAFRKRNRDERGVWLGGLVLAIVLPAGLLAWHLWGPVSETGAPPALFVMELPGIATGPLSDAGSGGWSPTLVVGLIWASLSLLLAISLALSMNTLRRLRQAARPQAIRGRMVRLSTEVGPAVLGFLRPEILLPEWILGLREDEAEWILLHEEQHVRARDPLLLLLAHIARVVLPWHPLVWYGTRGLVLAIEIDCDRRVLQARPLPGAYGRTLVQALSRSPRPLRAAAAFSLRRHELEERITTMTRPRRSLGPLGLLSVLAGTALVVGACVIPVPTDASTDDAEVPASSEVAPEEIDLGATRAVSDSGPRFTPYTIGPELINRAEIGALLSRLYPVQLRDAGIGGSPRVWIYIADDGRVLDRRLDTSSGYAELDEAAMEVADAMRFTAALNRDQPTAVWVVLPVTFGTAAASPRGGTSADGARPLAAPTREPTTGPSFTPFTHRPELTNPDDVGKSLLAEYPPLLRNAGIGGVSQVWFHIGADGTTREVRLRETSGHAQLDGAALRVAASMRFTPARNREKPVDAWVSLPITFQVR